MNINCLFSLLLFALVLSPHAEKAHSVPKITEDKISRYVENAYVSEEKGLFHPKLALYASVAGINMQHVVSVLKISAPQKENTRIFIGPNDRYDTPGYWSATTRIFEVVRVKFGDKRKILVLFNTQNLDVFNVVTFHKGWQLAELSDQYNLEKLHNFSHITKHTWPGGEAIYTTLSIKKNKIFVTITYEQPIRGNEVHTTLKYLFAPSEKGTLRFKKVIVFTKDGPMP